MFGTNINIGHSIHLEGASNQIESWRYLNLSLLTILMCANCFLRNLEALNL